MPSLRGRRQQIVLVIEYDMDSASVIMIGPSYRKRGGRKQWPIRPRPPPP